MGFYKNKLILFYFKILINVNMGVQNAGGRLQHRGNVYVFPSNFLVILTEMFECFIKKYLRFACVKYPHKCTYTCMQCTTSNGRFATMIVPSFSFML